MNTNLKIYNELKQVPENAKKKIRNGRLKGKTDVNPMWRIKQLTEIFGPCGIGWKPEIIRTWIETGEGGVKTANVQINLYVKADNGEWSCPIPGLGGALFVSRETGGLYTNDECFKMAYTDALSVCGKMLGLAADVYYEKDISKYDFANDKEESAAEYYLSDKNEENELIETITHEQADEVDRLVKEACADSDLICQTYGVDTYNELSKANYEQIKRVLSKRLSLCG